MSSDELSRPGWVSEVEAESGPTEPTGRKTRPLDLRSRAELDRYAAPGRGIVTKLIWLGCVVALLLTLRYFVPYFVEELQYAATRGRQRAEHEAAVRGLEQRPLEQLSLAYEMVSQRVVPSVVHIELSGVVVSDARHERGAEDGESWLPRYPRDRSWTFGQGSGVIIDPSGFIVTNRHVVDGAGRIRVRLSDGRTMPASVVGRDELTDLAVLKVAANGLIAAEWGDSDRVRPGALVWAVGSPFGLDQSVTSGILSGKNRAGKAGSFHQDFLQTDAAVNPGNSGGPLVDAQGRVIGINTAIVGHTYQGIGFAVPSNVARRVYERIRAGGSIERGWLGVQPERVTVELVERLGLPQSEGAYIAAVVGSDGDRDASPARRAGVEVGDVIVRWNDHPIRSPGDLMLHVGDTPVGSRATLALIRQGQPLELEVIVDQRPTDW